jgi:hypothetical protein
MVAEASGTEWASVTVVTALSGEMAASSAVFKTRPYAHAEIPPWLAEHISAGIERGRILGALAELRNGTVFACAELTGSKIEHVATALGEMARHGLVIKVRRISGPNEWRVKAKGAEVLGMAADMPTNTNLIDLQAELAAERHRVKALGDEVERLKTLLAGSATANKHLRSKCHKLMMSLVAHGGNEDHA